MDALAIVAEERLDPGRPSCPASPTPATAPADCALVRVGLDLKERAYRFTTITPLSHRRVTSRRISRPASLEDIFGWSRTFAPADLPDALTRCLAEAGELRFRGRELSSGVRFSTLGDQLFVHSAFPTDDPDAVFFGPDTYRFARLLAQSLDDIPKRPNLRVLDIGAGSGAGGLHVAALLGHRSIVRLADINHRALRFSKINAALNDVRDVEVIESDLFAALDGTYDLIISNPPYLVDPLGRLYRHGGGDWGFELSLKIAEQGVRHLAPGGRLVLYTGTPIVDGRDVFHDILRSRLAAHTVRLDYQEIDPDVFGEELEHAPYDRAERIAVVGATIDVP